MMNIVVKNLYEPWFSLTKLNIKSVEVRLNKMANSELKIGDQITFINDEFNFDRAISRKIVKIMKFETFEDCLKTIGISRCVPAVKDLEEALKIYHYYYSGDDEMKYGVIAFFLSME